MRSLHHSLLFIFGLFVYSCEEQDDLSCGYVNPLTELDWLEETKAIVDESCLSINLSLYQATYERNTVFYLKVTDPSVQIEFSVTLYNCAGEAIKTFDSTEQNDYSDQVKNRQIIYSCENTI